MTVKNSTRLISLLLVIIMAAAAFCSCSGSGTNPVTTTGSGTATEATTTAEPEFVLPDADYSGHVFNILYVGRGSVMTNDFVYTDTNQVLDNAKYLRNKAVEEKYGVTIKTDEKSTTANQKSPEAYATLMKQANSGLYDYDCANIPGYDVSELSYLGFLYDLNSLPNVDFTNSWWDQQVYNSFRIKDCLFFTTGDANVSMMDQTYCIAFNKSLAETENIPDLYAIVNNGEWTVDKFRELSVNVVRDMNGDGDSADTDDLHGILWWDDTMYGILNSAGVRMVTVNNDTGDLELTMMNERSETMIDKYLDLILNTDCGVRYQHNSANKEFIDIFSGDHALFFMTTIGHLSYFRDMTTDYGILPYFKLDTTQADYETTVAPFYMTYTCVPLLVEDEVRTGMILEAIGFYSNKYVLPAYYEKTLVGQYVRDDESADMLDIIFSGRAYDYGYCFQPGNLNKELIYMIRDRKKNDFVTTYASFESKTKTALEQISESYQAVIATWE